MNWRVSALDRYQLISNSDAHSPAKLGREANLFDIPLSYEGLSRAIQTGEGLYGTIEFFPEEGKYHMDGHRKCNLCLTPSDTLKYNGICPVCGRKITIGVSHRVEELSDRAEGYIRENAKPFESLVPLPEVIGASSGHSAASVKVQREYQKMLSELGPEFEILRNLPLEDIRRVSGTRVAEGIGRLRRGQVERIPGFDGEYGVIKLFSAEELNNTEGQMSFFEFLGTQESEKGKIENARKKETGKADGRNQRVTGRKAADYSRTKRIQRSAAEYVCASEPGAGIRCPVYVASYCGKGRPRHGKDKDACVQTPLSSGIPESTPGGDHGGYIYKSGGGRDAGAYRERDREEAGRPCNADRNISCDLSEFPERAGRRIYSDGRSAAADLAEEVISHTGVNAKPGKFLEQVSRRKSGIEDALAGDAVR